MRGPPPSTAPLAGHRPLDEPGYTYLPRFVSAAENAAIVDFLSGLHPLWEHRHPAEGVPDGRGPGTLTRPVYWLGAWQFAALGYYHEPDHTADKCLRAEPIPAVLLAILERLRGPLADHGDATLPNTCLINFYGQTPKGPGRPPVDLARLQMHRDGEPGPVVMLSIGQPAQFEFVDPDRPTPVHSQWIRNRSAVLLSGPEYKDRLYHRVTRVRYGDAPTITAHVDDFAIRRVSISFRHVPSERILDLCDLGPDARAVARPYVERLAQHSAHFRAQVP